MNILLGSRLVFRISFLALVASPSLCRATTQTTVGLDTVECLDTYIVSSQASTNFESQTELKNGGNGDAYRILMRFPTSLIPAGVRKATLRLFCHDNRPAGAQSVAQELHQITSTWPSGVTWSNQPSSIKVSDLPAGMIGEWVSIDITALVQAWQSGAVNYGLEIQAKGNSNQWNHYLSKEHSVAAMRPYIEFDTTTVANTGDSDFDLIPDAWEQANQLNPDQENYQLGNKSQGNLLIPAGSSVFVNELFIPISTSIPAGSTSISDIPISGLTAGDVLLLHVTQAAVGAASPAGTYELVKISSIGVNSVTVSPPVANAYTAAPTTRIQCVRVPQYDQVTVHGSILAPTWNGSTGGLVAFIAQNTTVTASGNIDVTGRGFRGAPELSLLVVGSSGGTAHQGEGYVAASWPLPRTTAANYSGGGGGGHAPSDLPNNFHGEGGGGGGNAIPGTSGGNYNGFYPNGVGSAGSMVATATTNLLVFGGGGGGGGVNGFYDAAEYGGFGGAGGGAILLISGSLNLQGQVSASGTIGQSKAHHAFLDASGGYDNRSPGGGGAGGSILISARMLGTGSIAALPGKSGDMGNILGDGAPGRIQMNRESFGNARISPASFGSSSSSILPSSMSWLLAYQDQDQDGLDDFLEFQAGSSPNLPDTDRDGLPDLWETQVGLSPVIANGDVDPDNDGFSNWLEYLIGSNPLATGGTLFIDSDYDGVPDSWEQRFGTQVSVADAHLDLDDDDLSNFEEFRLGSRPDRTDSDSDGLSDVAERFTYGTRLMSADTDSDGMPDAWEVTNGLNPLFNDATLDSDGDGLSNTQEYNSGTNSTHPLQRDSDNNGVSDYEQRNGVKFIKHRYDRSDRLVASHYDNGAWEGWRYDGNGNILRHLLRVSRDADSDGLADAWEFAQGLAFDSSTGSQGFGGDADGDGWTNQQEFLADTAANDITSTPSTGAGSTAWATPPKSRIVFPAASGGALAHVSVRLWDAEANRAQATLQWWDATASLWKPATLSKVNNGPITSATSLTTTPAGTTHDFLWNALADLPAHNGTILLRTTAQDPAGTTTSETIPYALNTAGDFDGDGIPDTWEIAHNLDPNDATGATADADDDGLNNFGEYVFGLNVSASDANDATTLGEAINPADGKRYLTLTYRKLINATGLIYAVQTSPDLAIWTSNGTDIEPVSTVPVGDAITELVTVRVKPSLGTAGANKFVRVHVTTQTPQAAAERVF